MKNRKWPVECEILRQLAIKCSVYFKKQTW